jgi:hypothetical protein
MKHKVIINFDSFSRDDFVYFCISFRQSFSTMATAQDSRLDEIKCKEWMKLTRMLKVCLRQALLDVLQDPKIDGLPKDKTALKDVLQEFRFENEHAMLGEIISKDQWDRIYHKCTENCPSPCNTAGESDIRSLNISTLAVLVQYLTETEPPKTGWLKEPAEEDGSKSACVVRANRLREDQFTGAISCKSTDDLQSIWLKTETCLKGLEYGNMDVFYYLKEAAIHELESEQIEALVDKCASYNIRDQESDLIAQEIEVLKNLVKSYSLKDEEIDKLVVKTHPDKVNITMEENDETVIIEIIALENIANE